MAQFLKSCVLIAFLSVAFFGVAFGHVAEQNYWNTMLPSTPMPQALLNALSNSEKADGMNKASFLKEDTDNAVFFQEKDLIPGTKLSNVHFQSNMQSPRFASPQMAQKMPPLSSKNLPQLFQYFGVSPNSNNAKIMSQTVQKCEQPEAFNAGVQFCATSLRKMVTQVTAKFGDSKTVKAVSMPAIHTDTPVDYKITGVKKIEPGQSMIACHSMSYPVGLYYCHQPSDSEAYAVSLVGVQSGEKHDTYAMCHQHHSDWIPKHAFKTLGVKSGTKICHFNHIDDVIWYKA